MKIEDTMLAEAMVATIAELTLEECVNLQRRLATVMEEAVASKASSSWGEQVEGEQRCLDHINDLNTWLAGICDEKWEEVEAEINAINDEQSAS